MGITASTQTRLKSAYVPEKVKVIMVMGSVMSIVLAQNRILIQRYVAGTMAIAVLIHVLLWTIQIVIILYLIASTQMPQQLVTALHVTLHFPHGLVTRFVMLTR
jgi:hypothetical protein